MKGERFSLIQGVSLIDSGDVWDEVAVKRNLKNNKRTVEESKEMIAFIEMIGLQIIEYNKSDRCELIDALINELEVLQEMIKESEL